MNYFDKYCINYDSKGTAFIDRCLCRGVMDRKTKCSESKCKNGLTFEEAKHKLIKMLKKDIEFIDNCKTFYDYTYHVR